MKILQSLAPFVLAFALAGLLLPAAGARPDAGSKDLSTLDGIADEFKSVPCKNSDRQQAAMALMEKMGAPHDAVTLQHYRNVDDIVVVKPGATDDKIVIGAHYDKVEAGCGAIDNWTGVVTVAHLYNTFKDKSFKKTVVFVVFGKEESGLIGSSAMVSSIDKDEALHYCAMVNIDSLGQAIPQVADNMSSKKLELLAEITAKNMKMPFGHAVIGDASADSVPFVQHKIPAMTIHGLAPHWESILHSSKDQVSAVDPKSVLAGYLLTVNVINSIDQSPCESFR
jgi:Iap family predicted aminopeptidase